MNKLRNTPDGSGYLKKSNRTHMAQDACSKFCIFRFVNVDHQVPENIEKSALAPSHA